MFKEEKINVFISAVSESENEVKILLKTIENANYSKDIFKDIFNLKLFICGNDYVISLLNKYNFKIESDLSSYSTDSFPLDFEIRDEIFVGLMGNYIKSTDFPNINLKNDFCNAYKILDSDMGILPCLFYFSFKEPNLFNKIDHDEIKKSNKIKKYLMNRVFHDEYNNQEEFECFFKNGFYSLLEERTTKINGKKSKNSKNNNNNTETKSFTDIAIEIYKSNHNLPENIFDEELIKHMEENIGIFDENNIRTNKKLDLDAEAFNDIRNEIMAYYCDLNEFEREFDYLKGNDLFNKYDYKDYSSKDNQILVKELIYHKNSVNNEIYQVISKLKDKLKFTTPNNFIFLMITFFESLEFDVENFGNFLQNFYDEDIDNSDEDRDYINNESKVEKCLEKVKSYLEDWDIEYKEFRKHLLKEADFHYNLISLLESVIYGENEEEYDLYNLIQLLLYLEYVINKTLDNFDYLKYNNDKLSKSTIEDVQNQYNKLRKSINKWIRNIKILKKGLNILIEQLNP